MHYDFVKGEILLVNKPYGWTSFDVVNKIKWLLRRHLKLKKLKIGHGGTLDPLASGLMLLATGKMTRRLEEFQNHPKEYEAEICFGATTPSFDMETAPDRTFPTDHITLEAIREVLEKFKGPQSQTPPLFSAKKIDGKRAYDLARNDIQIELKAVNIVIENLDLLAFTSPVLKIRVLCSKGTYIRSLAHDIGKALGSGAYLAGLVRTASGGFRVEEALTIDQLESTLFPHGNAEANPEQSPS